MFRHHPWFLNKIVKHKPHLNNHFTVKKQMTLFFIAEEAPRDNLETSPFQTCSSTYLPCETFDLGRGIRIPYLLPGSSDDPRL